MSVDADSRGVALGAQAPRSSRALTLTERNWLLAAAILLGSLVLFAAIYAVELDLGRWNARLRLVPNPAEAAMRYLGVSHFLVAFLFLTTSKKMRAPGSWITFVAALAIGTALCLGYRRVQVWNPVVASILFFAYFVIHDFRDQVFFYFTNGDAPATRDRKGLSDLLVQAPFLVLMVLLATAAALLATGALNIPWLNAPFVAWPRWERWALGLIPACGAAILAWRYGTLWRREKPGRFADFARSNRPILLVLGAAVLILLAQKGFAIVTLHVTCWYVFALGQIRRNAPAAAPRAFSWRWLRGTPAGFNLLHIGSAAALILVGGIWAYGFGNDSSIAPLRILLDPDSFSYWTIVHVTASLGAR
jgi:hypothetical protein